MLAFISIVHVVLCVFLIFVILLQPGKDAGMGAALGGGAATSAFGGRGATTFLSKVTAVSAALFFVTSLGLSFVGLRQSVAGSVAAPAATSPAPAAPTPQDTTTGAATNPVAPDAKGVEAPAAGEQAAPAAAPTGGEQAAPAAPAGGEKK